ncbi:MAG: inositol 2-dehydrogenase [Flavobacteriaceae bacterium]|jgi:myo-inositol 2-dehydrogenase/D-chiro-inositol 1-dehydrogenase|nr:inositol 2-dehydrogenase [Flavobacteriaceae bacterium]MBT5857716.1 inositol 2-dehydrogenase [Flavobacteriaceae bacterium]MBT6689407.1 inositol 2-dehydrogenase [Flavobacteriaceae bacterium]MBT7319929.1 inositol 2-dehydrogenase [Flavobacteriaceae bacterium]MBT7553803.1 inositol 2-dehydrogenase [Flavobacteriaceae bacterium]
MIKIGIVGLGRIGKVHLFNIQQLISGASVIAACSRSEKSLEYAKKHSVKGLFTSFDDMLSEGGIDAVIIASPTALHFEHLKLAIAAGKHIFCEKPIDLSIENVKEIKSLLDANPVKFMVGFNRRYDPNVLKIKKELNEGRLGAPQSVKIISRDPGPPPMEYIKTSGGLFLDMAIHDFDLARYLMNSEITEVYSTASIFGDLPLETVEDVDTAVTILKFKNKGFATIENSRNSTYGYDQRIEVFGEKGLLSAQNKSDDSVYFANNSGFHRPKPVGFFIERYKESYINILDSFVQCLEQNKDLELTFQDGLQSLAISLAAKKSSKQNRTVLLSEII